MLFRHSVRAGLFVALLPVGAVAQTAPIRGFPADALAERSRLEQVLIDTPDAARLDRYLLAMTEEPHHAGGPGSKAVAEYALARFLEWGLDAKIEEFEAYMPLPVTREVEMVAPTRYRLRLEEMELEEDKDSGDRGQLPTYNAYSADGDVTGELVFVNYGMPEDYEQLEELGVDVRGKVVIAKYGRSWRGIKPKVAAEHGAIATLLYSDPRDDGFVVDDDYPTGPMRPEWGAQRGSVMDMPTYPGDPLTPGWGSRAGGEKMDVEDVTTIMKIPVLPISWGDALPLLKALGGPVAPNNDWKGGLPLTYHVGPGPARVRVHLEFDWKNRTLYNVVVRIPGTTDADQMVIHGNHHDAWVNGANDPTSGAVALMESVRSVSELMKTGWRPKRTMVFALWDGEEWGLLGSTEWAEHYRDQLDEQAAVYLNSDSYSRGWFGGGGSHTLTTFVGQLARDIPQPGGGTALEAVIARGLENASTARDSNRIRDREYSISPLGSGSDYTVFIDHLTLPSLNIGFGGAQRAGVYHSIYDSYDFFTRFYDPGFEFGRSQATAFGLAMTRLADAPLLPFSFTDAAGVYRIYADEVDSLARREISGARVEMGPVNSAIDRLEEAGRAFDVAFDRTIAQGSSWLEGHQGALKDINQQIYLTERDLRSNKGLPRREWFRHTIYAPGFYTGYGVKTMPGIREAAEQGDGEEAQAEAVIVAAAIDRMAERVEGIVRALNGLQ
jgi:N-acetylated-alpha-linked acidic dipeptidase